MTHHPFMQRVTEMANVDKPTEQPSARDWLKVEQKLACVLPDDYKQIVSAVGAGEFGELWLFSPNSPSKYTRLSKERTLLYRKDVKRIADEVGLVLFPDPGGFLLIGSCPNSMDLLIKPICGTMEYDVAWFDRDLRDIHVLRMSVCQFLHDLYTDSIPEEWARQVRTLLWEPGQEFFTARPSDRRS